MTDVDALVRALKRRKHEWQKARMHARFVKSGAQIAPSVRFTGRVNLGSEPYLISIGENVAISGDVAFITHDGALSAFRRWPGYEDTIKFGRITVHRDTFIGYGVVVLPGVTIGANSVIAAGSVVNKDVPDHTVVGGVPAKRICSTEEFADKSRSNNPDYDHAAYWADKRAELLRLYPRPW